MPCLYTKLSGWLESPPEKGRGVSRQDAKHAKEKAVLMKIGVGEVESD